MTTPDPTDRPDPQHAEDVLSFCGDLRHRLGMLALRLRPMWREAQQLAAWLEHNAFPAAREAGEWSARLHVEVDADGPRVSWLADRAPKAPGAFRQLGAFLHRLGIREMVLETRLEGNQVSDVLALLYAYRRAVQQGPQGTRPASELVEQFRGPGVQVACTRTRLDDGTLTVRYSYCTTRFSRLVRWFEQRSRDFSDHRALFNAAPRYGLAAAAIGVLPFVAYMLANLTNPPDYWWALLAGTILEGVLLFGLVYLSLMTAGSLEYDNEEKADRLARANVDLQRYADHIHDDLLRARRVQERILPEPASMPLTDHLAWATSFVPQTEVGGDYFDTVAFDDHRVGIVFADVSGHGVAAAFVTAIIKTAFQSWGEQGGDLTGFVHRLNQHLCRLTPDDSFAAAFVAVYDASTRELTYINAGHYPEPWLVPADGTRPVECLDEATQLLLGVEARTVYEPATRRLAVDDTVLLLTDGLIEARNTRREMFGIDRLEAFIAANPRRPPERLLGSIVEAVARFAGDTDPEDDRTALAFQVRG